MKQIKESKKSKIYKEKFIEYCEHLEKNRLLPFNFLQ